LISKIETLIFITFALLSFFINIANAQNEWDKYTNNPILSPDKDSTWIKSGISNPSVIFKDGEFKMWFTGFDGKNMRIGYATSPDGIKWTNNPNNPILDLGENGAWDSIHVANPSVLFDGIIYKMWYTGFDGEHMQIGYANSPDGIHWQKCDENPVLKIGAWGGYDSSDVWSPSVVFDGTNYKMWFTTYDGNLKIGYAYSSDGIHWAKNTSTPALNIGEWGAWDDRGVWSPDVIFDGFEYRMWFTGWNGTNIGIGYATSPDGINWTKPYNKPVLNIGTTGEWDYYYASNASIVLHDKKYKMWYSGCSSDEVYKIGYAVGATRPEIFLSDIFHDFDDVEIGKYVDWEFKIYNKGNNDLLINSITSDDKDFMLISSVFDNGSKPVKEHTFSKPYLIQPQGYISIVVRFTRGKEKNYNGSITIKSNDKNHPEALVQLWMGSKLKYVRPIPDNFRSFDRDLQFGDRNQDVRFLQVILAEEGPSIYPESEINWSINDFTRRAIIEFQRKHKLADSFGYVGSETRKKLTELLNKHRKENYDRVNMVYDAVIGNYMDFLPDDFPPEIVLAIASQETGLFYNFNNELVEVREDGNKDNVGRGIMQITTSDYVGAGNRANMSNLAFDCRNLINRDSVYRYYSNTPQGVEANLRDGLYALRDKYNQVKNSKEIKQFDITKQEMHWISAIQRYNTYGKVIFSISGDTDFRNNLNKGVIPDKLMRAFESNNDFRMLSKNATIITEELNRRWCIIDDSCTYILRRDEGTIYACRAGIPTIYVKNIAEKLRSLKSPILFPKANSKLCNDLADKMDVVYNNSQTITLGCPAELKVYDTDGRMTGSLISNRLVNNGFDPQKRDGVEEIPNSIYIDEDKTVVLMFPSDKHTYEVIGTGEGFYNLYITNIINGEMATFNAVNLPITSKTVHRWTIDWNALNQGDKGIKLQMDTDGDGIFERSIITYKKLINSIVEPQS
jgi:predicted GH43/DUF377 family glycosyl hydrolase